MNPIARVDVDASPDAVSTDWERRGERIRGTVARVRHGDGRGAGPR